jgi:Skp family chaperone for outer membrane proteins
MVATYRKVEPTLTQAQKTTRESKIGEYQTEVQQKMQELDQTSQQRQMEINRPLVDQVKLALEDLRVEGGYTMIFDIGGNVNPVVAWDKNLDITDRVTAKLRTQPIPALGGKTVVPAKPAGAPVSAPAGVKPPIKP